MAHQGEAEIRRPVANFSPSLWGDQFIKHHSAAAAHHHQVGDEEHSETVEVMKNEVKGMLTGKMDHDTMMRLIDTLERLGVSYHFETEIEEKLHNYFDVNTNYNDEAYDLYTVALHFRLFRQHGHRISADVFGRWRDETSGKFKECIKSDAEGLLSLYEASYLRTREETILDDALDFATATLQSIAPRLESPLKEQVMHALIQPLHFGNPRIEARNFISIYEKYEEKNESLLRFAKLDYNLLQMLHKEELHQVSRWWKDLELVEKLPYARDRVVECFFWAMGVYHEPHYSRARVMLTKTIAMTSIIDDTYDAYGTIQELDILTQAIQRWNIKEMESLPEYVKPLYKALLELYEQFEQELSNEGRSYAAHYAIESLKELVRSYHLEAKWFIQGYLPPFEEYLKNALITCTYCYHTTTSLLGVESAVEEDFQWLSKKPKMLVAGLLICRVIDDIATYEVEKDRGQIGSGMESYMRDNGATKEEAIAKFLEIAGDAWKDVNEEWVQRHESSRDIILLRILNLERIIDVTYKGNEDGYSHPEKVLKPHIIALFVDPIPI